MLAIEPHNLHWLDTQPPAHDYCAHGGVLIRIGDQIIADQRESEWTLSAAALYLLRTLSHDHTRENPVGDHLFPCCGHAMFPDDNSSDVVIVGCPNGFDFEVRRQESSIQLVSSGAFDLAVPAIEWHRGVLGFSDRVHAFYESSAVKEPQVDAEGYAAFCAEWKRRREQHHLEP